MFFLDILMNMASTSTLSFDKYQIDEENLETFHIVWLSDDIKENENLQRVYDQLRVTNNSVIFFTKTHECQKYIEKIPKQDHVILITDGRLGHEIISHIHQFQQVLSIFMYCLDAAKDGQWIKEYKKVRYSCNTLTHIDSCF